MSNLCLSRYHPHQSPIEHIEKGRAMAAEIKLNTRLELKITTVLMHSDCIQNHYVNCINKII